MPLSLKQSSHFDLFNKKIPIYAFSLTYFISLKKNIAKIINKQ